MRDKTHKHDWRETKNFGHYILDTCIECSAEREIRRKATDTYTMGAHGYNVRKSASTSKANVARLEKLNDCKVAQTPR